MKKVTFSMARMTALLLTFALALTACGGKKDSGGGGGDSGGSGGEVSVPEVSVPKASGKSSGGGKANPASDFTYDLTADGQGIIIKGFTGKGPKVVIPETIEDIPVVEIDRDVFNGKTMTFNLNAGSNVLDTVGSKANEKAGITSITLPNTLKKIGDSAFENSGITSIIIPDSVTEIDISAFYDCANLTEVKLSDNLTKIPADLFGTYKEGSGLKKVNLPKNLTGIGYAAFDGCTELTELVIPDTLTSVEFYKAGLPGEYNKDPDNSAFSGCGKLPIKTRQIIQGWGYTGKF
jgi:hypothetical protein